MRKLMVGAAVGIAGLASAAHALPGSRDRFVHEASGYVVETREVGGGTLVLKGHHPMTGRTFHLKVSPTGRVTGTFAGEAVAFVTGRSRNVEVAAVALGVGAK